jgi:hypothetical protein
MSGPPIGFNRRWTYLSYHGEGSDIRRCDLSGGLE